MKRPPRLLCEVGASPCGQGRRRWGLRDVHPAVTPGVISQRLERLYDVAREPIFRRVVVPTTAWRVASAFDCDCAPQSATHNRLQKAFGVHEDDSSRVRVSDVAGAPHFPTVNVGVLELHLEGGIELAELITELD